MNKFYLCNWLDCSLLVNQFLRVTKITVIITTCFLLQLNASAKAQSVTLKETSASLENIIKKIKAQTNYDFIGDSKVIKMANLINIDIKNVPLTTALNITFRNQPLNYRIVDKTIIIEQAFDKKEVSAKADNITMQGTVLSEDGDIPLPGTSVLAVGTNIKAITDVNGKFSISFPESVKILRFSYIGYINKDFKIDGKDKKITVRMSLNNNELSTVTITTGVYERPIENFTGSAKTITAAELRRVSPTNVFAALAILDPAFKMPENINNGSDPNTLPEIELRGQNNFPTQTGIESNSSASLKNIYGDKPNAPMFVLDGFQVQIQRVFDLDMNRVERITILKDAAATSIYGSRASNGVVVIDTRQPKEGSVTISYRGGLSITAPDLSSYNLMNASEKLSFEKEIGYYKDSRNFPLLQVIRDAEYNERLKAVTSGVYTDWLFQPIQTAVSNNQSIYVEGGDKAVRYGINVANSNNVGVMKGSGRDKFSGGVTLTYRNSKLLFRNDLSINKTKATNSPYGSFSQYSKLNPYWSPYDENGNLVKFLGEPRRNATGVLFTSYANPLYDAVLPSKSFTDQLGFTNNFSFQLALQDWIKVTGKVAYSHNKISSDSYLSSKHTSFESLVLPDRGSYTKTDGKSDVIDASLGFDIRKAWNKNLVFFTGNLNAIQGKESQYSNTAIGFPNDDVAEFIFANRYDPDSPKPIGSQGISRLISGRINGNYSFDNKYLFDASLSVDASSQFGSDRSLAPFWSVGIGWNMHKESFIKNIKHIDFLKLRASVGTTGEQNFPPYMALSTYRYYSDQYYLNELSAYLVGYGNANLGWQKSLKRNIGFDATLFENRVSISADYYYSTTNDLILDISTPPSLGFSSYKENAGALKNIGWQANANINIIQNTQKQLFWRVGISATANKNTITKISNSLKKLNDLADAQDANLTNPDRNKPKIYYKEGQSLSAIFAVKSLGIDPANGQELFQTINGNTTYVWSANDKVNVGDTRPKISGTLSTGVDYRGFGFNIYMLYRLGASVYNQTLVDRVENPDVTYNVDKRVGTERWMKPGDQVFFKGIIGSDDGRPVVETTLATSRFVQKENMISGSSVSFNYQFNNNLKWMKKAKLSNTRLELYWADPFQISSIKRERGLIYPFANTFTFNISTSIF